MRRIAAVMAVLACVPGLARAAVEAETFAGRTIDWTFGEQRFDEDGRTRDRLFRDRYGWWEIREGALCFLWPPREDWECVVTTLGPGPAVRFAFPDGTIYDGAFRE